MTFHRARVCFCIVVFFCTMSRNNRAWRFAHVVVNVYLCTIINRIEEIDVWNIILAR